MSAKLSLIFSRQALRRQLYQPKVAYAYMKQMRLYGNEKSAEKERSTETTNTDGPDAAKLAQLELEKINIEIKTLREKHDELTDKYKRSLAESENMRIRLTKQIEDAKIYGIQTFCKDLLDVADTLGNATKSVPEEALKEDNPHLKNLYEGLTMTQAVLMQVFKRNGLEQINPINQKFNPNFHEALFQKVDEQAAPDTIIEVTKLGYTLRDRLIRPALVGVAKAP